MDEVTTRLWRGVKKGDTVEVTAALEQGALVDSRDKLERTPLMEAAKRGRLPVIRLLLVKGADVNAKDYSGQTPLVSAITPHQLTTVRLLIASGASVSQADTDGEKAYRKARKQQILTGFGALLRCALFLYFQQNTAKDKELQQIEWFEMAFRVYGEIVTLQKYQRIAQIIKEAGG